MTTHASAYARGSRPNTRTSGCSSDWPTNSAPTARRTRCRAGSRWPDVLFIDNLYVAWNGAFDVLDFKLGRQDMSFGAQRIVSDGTGGDGSRSAYFDGLRVTWHADEKRTLDMFGIYQTFDDWLPTLGKEHANGEKPHDYDMTGYGQDEYGLGLYWQDRANEDFGYDAYYVAKGERRPSHAKHRKEGSHADSHTFGVRLLPRFTRTSQARASSVTFRSSRARRVRSSPQCARTMPTDPTEGSTRRSSTQSTPTSCLAPTS